MTVDWTPVAVAVITAVPVTVGILVSWRPTRRAARSSSEVLRSIGPTNGESLVDILVSIKEFEAYQRTRNHDLMNHLGVASLNSTEILKVVDEILVRIKTEGGIP